MSITLGTVIPRWLSKTGRKILAKARIKSTGKSGSAQGKPRINYIETAKKIVFRITRFHAGRPPLDDEIKVPIGGFPPTAESARILGVDPPTGDHWVFIKPEGRVVRRSRTYSRFSGQTIKKKGFLSEAVREVMIGPIGQRNLRVLSHALAVRMASEIASELVKDLNANGIPASFTLS